MHLVTILPDAIRRRGPWSLPNLLTYGRILAIPALVAILFWPRDDWMRWLALGIYTIAAITDYLDGYIARAWSQQSAIGRMLDPIADKLLVASCLLVLVADGSISGFSIVAAVIILIRSRPRLSLPIRAQMASPHTCAKIAVIFAMKILPL